MIKLRTTQINLYKCFHPLMTNTFEMEAFLESLVDFIGMTVISEDLVKQRNPHAFVFNPSDKVIEDHGISGFVMLVESHIAIHSWPTLQFLNIVITSCKEYSPLDTAKFVSEYCNTNIYLFDSFEI